MPTCASRRAAESAARLDISEQEICAYPSRVALGPEWLDEVFVDEDVATVPPGRLQLFRTRKGTRKRSVSPTTKCLVWLLRK